MKTYNFPQFKVEIVNPTIEIQQVNDALTSKTCNVDILLTTDTAKFGVNLQGFTYVDSWEDSDIENWVINVELPKYEI
jgi:hypothetical protein